MKRLTEKKEDGTWALHGVCWDEIRPGGEISKQTSERLYMALCKLKDYEDTGLSPDEVEKMKWKLMDSDL